MPQPYCAPHDVLRRLDQPIDRLDSEQLDRLRARTAAISHAWDRETGRPLRAVRVGTPEAPRTWERHDAAGGSRGPPVVIDLDHGDIAPIDAGAGDTIEVRIGRDTWEDVTAAEGDDWTLDYDRGQLKLFRVILPRRIFEHPSERFVRLTYRHGALGGDRDRGGQTTLDSDASASAATLSVTDTATLPANAGVLSLGTGTIQEYVRVADIDRATDTLTVTRGIRGTSQVDHGSNTIVQYVPPDVRDAVAARVAAQAILDDESRTSIPDDGQLTGPQAKAERFQAEWDDALARYGGVISM